jgi:thioredoxin reductase (NADPH)
VLAVDDDPDVLRAVERDLRKQYSGRYRVLSADSGPAALDILKRLARRSEPVALLVADHRMPYMSGIEFLSAAICDFPDVRRVLLTAYADTEAAIHAINVVKLDHYLLKPWDPPNRNLYPVLDDLLDQWSASYHAPFEGIRVIGTRWSRRCYEVRDFLARNQIPYQWLNVEVAQPDPDTARLLASLGNRLPVVLLADGSALVDPEPSELRQLSVSALAARVPFSIW